MNTALRVALVVVGGLIGVLLFVSAFAVTSVIIDPAPTSTTPKHAATTTDTSTDRTPVIATTHDTTSRAQRNALKAAQDYLDIMPFSRTGLIEQLSSEHGSGYTTSDATWAVNHLTVDWNVQAERAAKNYLDTMPMSARELYDQLIFEGYTKEQAQHGVDSTGL